MYGLFFFFFFSTWQIAFGCLAGRKQACSPSSSSLSPLTEYQAREEKEDEEEEILAVLLSSSPSLPCSRLPGSAGRQMTRVCGRLITPGWVFSNLFNGSLLKQKKKKKTQEEGGKDDEHKREAGLSPRWPGESTQPMKNQRRRRRGCTDSPGRDTREDQTTPEEEEEREKEGKKHKKHNAHY